MNTKRICRKFTWNLSLIAPLALSFGIACSQDSEKNGSSVKQLTETDFVCWEPSQLRLEEVKAKIPDSFINGFSNDDVYKRLAGLPDQYLDVLLDYHKDKVFSSISETSLFGRLAGRTMLSKQRGDEFWTPTSIQIDRGQTNFSLQHEVGHAVEGFVKKQAKGLDNPGSSFAAIEDNIRANNLYRSYARSSDQEAFAELFASFYCSPESNQFVKENFSSEMYDFMEKAFEKAPWQLENSEQSEPTIDEQAVTLEGEELVTEDGV